MGNSRKSGILGKRFEGAFVFAAQSHSSQKKKGTEVPYMAHLMAVASLVLEDGGDEDQAIAALLHDSVEDQDVEPEELELRFGKRVRDIVVVCTDAFENPKPEWRSRKEKYLAHLREAPLDVLRVSASDKLHNARQILGDYRVLGEKVFERFKGKRDGTLWYYRSLVEILKERKPGPLTDELRHVVAELEKLASANG